MDTSLHDLLTKALSPYFVALAVALCIGLIIGLEREFHAVEKDRPFAGIRTFPLIAILGCSIAALGEVTGNNWIVAAAFPAFVVLVSLTYYVRSQKGSTGISTEVALLIVFTLGVMAGMHMIHQALGAAVITTTLLSLKGPFAKVITRISQVEVFAFIKFALLTLVLLPFLPDRALGPEDTLNPRDIGIVVAIVSGLSFIGYFLIKFIGAGKGILLTAFFGGLFSSTAVTWVYAKRSREQGPEFAPTYAAGIAIASAVMFARVAVVSFIFNAAVFRLLVLPCALLTVTELIAAYLFMRRSGPLTGGKGLELRNPLDLGNALFFAAIYVGISFVVVYADRWLGDRGLLISGIVSGLADVDAINITMSKLALDPARLGIASLVILTAVLSNTLVKFAIAIIKGSPAMRKFILLSTGSAMVVGLVYIVIHHVIGASTS